MDVGVGATHHLASGDDWLQKWLDITLLSIKTGLYTWVLHRTKQFIEGLRYASASKEDVGFHWFRRKLNIIVGHGPGQAPNFQRQGRFGR